MSSTDRSWAVMKWFEVCELEEAFEQPGTTELTRLDRQSDMDVVVQSSSVATYVEFCRVPAQGIANINR